MNEKDISATAVVSEKQVVVSNVVVNGVPQQQIANVVVMSCPSCGAIIQQFNPGVQSVEVLKALSTDKTMDIYCNNCGQKIRVERGEAIENEQQTVKSGE